MMNKVQHASLRWLALSAVAMLMAPAAGLAQVAPAGYVKQTIPLAAPPVALAFDSAGVLYALEEPAGNAATLRSILPDGSLGPSVTVVGDDPGLMFVGSMTYDPVGQRLLITDNAADGRLYAIDAAGQQQTVVAELATITGVAVRSTGEIMATTALSAGASGVYQIDRQTGAATLVVSGLDYGSGIDFDPDGHLVVQDARADTFRGRLQRVPITETAAGLSFGAPQPLLADAGGATGLLVDGDGEIFTTGSGGVFRVTGPPGVETPFYSNGNAGQFATAIALSPADAAFAPFSGPGGGALAVMADYGFNAEESFVTLFTPAAREDFNFDGVVDQGDLAAWAAAFGDATASPEQGDADGDGVVAGGDLLTWQRAVGSSTLLPGLAGSKPHLLSVPEPAGVAILFAAALFAWQSRRCSYGKA